MKLKKIEIETTIYAEDIISSIVFEKGIVGVQIENNQNLSDSELKEQYIDIPLINSVDDLSKVSFYVKIIDDNETINKNNIIGENIDNSYVESNDNIFTKNELDEIINSLKESFLQLKEISNETNNDEYTVSDYGTLLINIIDLDNFDYLNKWKEFFEPIYINDIIIKPSFKQLKEDIDTNDKIIITIDPGGAFGTGSHETTKLCITAICDCIKKLKKDNKEINFLDVGCGSGILGIIALKLGVSNTTNIDIDKSVIETVNNNLSYNNINDNFNLIIGNVINDIDLQNKLKLYDIIVANILAPVIISLLNILNIERFLKPNGYMIFSGILEEKLMDIINIINNKKNLKVEKIEKDGSWVCITVKKH